LYENIDTNTMYVCIFKHSFLKWTVGEKITRAEATDFSSKLHENSC